jgi:hypothetical protein
MGKHYLWDMCMPQIKEWYWSEDYGLLGCSTARTTYQTSWHLIREDSSLDIRCHKNLKSYAVLKWILKNYSMKVWAGFIWPVIHSRFRFLETHWWTFRICKSGEFPDQLNNFDRLKPQEIWKDVIFILLTTLKKTLGLHIVFSDLLYFRPKF